MIIRRPFFHESMGAVWQVAFHHLQSGDVEYGIVLSIHGMKVRNAMFALAEVHLDKNTVKSRDDWHFDLLKKVYHLFDEGRMGNESGLGHNVRETVLCLQ